MKIDYQKLARRLEKSSGYYVHPNQVKRYLENHPELAKKPYTEMYHVLHKYFLQTTDEGEYE